MSALSRSKAAKGFEVGKGRVIKTTPVFDTYWRFAVKRQDLFMRRVQGDTPPWTDDPVLSEYRFTNPYRAADRVSQYLIRNVLYSGSQSTEEVFFRCLLFKLFNKIETWEGLERQFGTPTLSAFSVEAYARVLDSMMGRGERIYSAAYIMPSPNMGSARKHWNHLTLLDRLVREGLPTRLERAASLYEVFALLRDCPSFGDFLAFQFAIDLNYSGMLSFSEMDFVVAGPGARDGIRKCFEDLGGLSEAEVIRAVAEHADREFERRGLKFSTLWGRPLQLIDCQNLFCEVDKYARVVHPEVSGRTGRTRIKQKYSPRVSPLPQWYPPKWKLNLFEKGAAKQMSLLFGDHDAAAVGSLLDPA